MKSLSVLLLAVAAAVALQSCDAKPTEVVKEVHDTDTVYTDRFAHKYPVVWGEWVLKMKSSSDSAQLVLLQDTTALTAYFFWKKGAEWVVSGSLSAPGDGIWLNKDTVIVSGKFTDSAGGKKTRIRGMVVNTNPSNLAADSFVAVRTR